MSELCRYTSKPLAECDCPKGCETNQMRNGEWVQPIRKGYRLVCCDCGLAHLVDFRIHKRHIQFRAFREDEVNDSL